MNKENIIADCILLKEKQSFLIKEGYANFLPKRLKENIKKIIHNLFSILTEEQLNQSENSSLLKIIYKDTYIKADSILFEEKFHFTTHQKEKINIYKNKLYKILMQIREKIEGII